MYLGFKTWIISNCIIRCWWYPNGTISEPGRLPSTLVCLLVWSRVLDWHFGKERPIESESLISI